MKKTWHVLNLHGVSTIDELIDELLPKIDGLPLRSQFSYCRIRSVSKRPLLTPGFLTSHADRERDLHFGVLLQHDAKIDDWLMTVPHEFAHTFGYRPDSKKPVRRWRYNQQEEVFAEEFAKRWVKNTRNIAQLTPMLQTLKDIPLDRSEIHTQYYTYEEERPSEPPSIAGPCAFQHAFNFSNSA